MVERERSASKESAPLQKVIDTRKSQVSGLNVEPIIPNSYLKHSRKTTQTYALGRPMSSDKNNDNFVIQRHMFSNSKQTMPTTEKVKKSARKVSSGVIMGARVNNNVTKTQINFNK
jgi:hypothetical protein